MSNLPDEAPDPPAGEPGDYTSQFFAIRDTIESVDHSLDGGSENYVDVDDSDHNELAALVQALEPNNRLRVLHVGCGTGLTSCVLARLSKRVFAVEENSSLASVTAERARALGYQNMKVRCAHPADGWSNYGPFDRILVSSMFEEIPKPLIEQLAGSSVLVGYVGVPGEGRKLVRLERTGGGPVEAKVLVETKPGERLGDLLVSSGAVQREVVEFAAKLASESGTRLGEVLVQQNVIEEPVVYRMLAVQKGEQGNVDAILRQLDPALIGSVPKGFLERHKVMPIRVEDDVLLVAAVDDTVDVTDLVQVLKARTAKFFTITATDYRRLWQAVELGFTKDAKLGDGEDDGDDGDDLLSKVPDALRGPYLPLLDALLLEAIGQRASDIHIERFGSQARLRIRVDGKLRVLDRFNLAAEELTGLLNTLKISASLDITEHRRPQGGRFSRRAGKALYDLRLQTHPSLDGETAVIRLLPRGQGGVLGVGELGMPPGVASRYRRLLQSPSGLVLLVGPTGAGKTTTLYAGLQELAEDATRKVITIEDPVEYTFKGIQQTQVHPTVGMDYANAMRSFVRQDPDVILLGEIRDKETAIEAVRASQTGHLVLSTLHCSESTGAIQRLLDLEVGPNSMATELVAIIAQRLARRVCEVCRDIDTRPDHELLAELFPDGMPEGFRMFTGEGCDVCHGSGIRGRIATMEVLLNSPEVRNAIQSGATQDVLRRVAVGAGLKPMREHMLYLVNTGVIPLSELKRLLSVERIGPELSAAGSYDTLAEIG